MSITNYSVANNDWDPYLDELNSTEVKGYDLPAGNPNARYVGNFQPTLPRADQGAVIRSQSHGYNAPGRLNTGGHFNSLGGMDSNGVPNGVGIGANTGTQSPYARWAANQGQNGMQRERNIINQMTNLAGTMAGQGGRLVNTGTGYYNNGMSNASRWAIEDVQDAVNKADENAVLASGASYRAAAERMEEMGINPNSGRFQGMAQRQAINVAALRAGVRNQARVTARQRNYANSLGIAQGGIMGLNSGSNLESNAQYGFANAQRAQGGLSERWMAEATGQNKEDAYEDWGL